MALNVSLKRVVLVTASQPRNSVNFGIGHHLRCPTGYQYGLSAVSNQHGTWLFRNKAMAVLPDLLAKRFPQGTSLMALGCSSGEGVMMTPAILIDQDPKTRQNADRYPMVGIDIEKEMVDVARQGLLYDAEVQAAQDYLTLHQKTDKAKMKKPPFQLTQALSGWVPAWVQWPSLPKFSFWNVAKKEVSSDPISTGKRVMAFDIEPRLHPTILSMLKEGYVGYPQDRYLGMSGITLNTVTDGPPDKSIPLTRLHPRIAKRLTYQVGDALAVTNDEAVMRRQGVVVVDNMMYQLTKNKQAQLARQLLINMAPGSLLVAHAFSSVNQALDELMQGMGFVPIRVSSSQDPRGGIIYERPKNPKPDMKLMNRFWGRNA